MEKLLKDLQETAQKINNGYEMSDYEKIKFSLACMYFNDILGVSPEICEAFSKIELPEAVDLHEKCEKFSRTVKEPLSEIMLNSDLSGIKQSKEYDYLQIKKDIISFYKKFEPVHYSKMSKQIFDSNGDNLLILNSFHMANPQQSLGGCSITFNKKGYVYVVENQEPDKIYIPSSIVHELGHIISYLYMDKHEICSTVFRETVPYSAQFAYLKTHSDKKEASKEYIRLLRTLKEIIKVYSVRNLEGHEFEYHYYINGYSIGLYLSHLYTTDNAKFRKYYNFIKENIYINDDKIMEFFLNDKDFLKMDYLKQDIMENKKILLR